MRQMVTAVDTITFTVAPNIGVARQGTITIAGKTFTVNQNSGCVFSIAPLSQNFTPAGGTGSFALTASDPTCPWTAVASDPWITITSSTSGTGNATINFTVAASIVPARTGTITVGGQTFTINQTSGCNYVLNPTSANLPAAGGMGTVTVTTATTCTWTAVSNDSWITVTGGASGTGNGSVSYTVAPNIGPARTGTITIAGQTFTVNQNGGCTYTLNPTSANVGQSGGTGLSFTVNTAPGCTWTATTSTPWISITNGSGTGNGTVTFNAAANNGDPRSGTITVNGQTFTVNQASGCMFSINPTSQNFISFGGNGSFALTTNPGCSWTAVSSDNWISIGNPTGTGNATINFTVSANNGQARSGTITVGGQVFTVTQDAISLIVNKIADTNDGVCNADCSLREALVAANASNSLIDSNFTPNVNGEIKAIAIQSDGKILIAGSFTQVNGVTRNRIARLNVNGTLDAFDPVANNTVLKLAVQSDGKILVGGMFTEVGGVSRNNIARLLADGTLDSTFNPNANSSVSGLAIQSNGKILVGGGFTNIAGTARNRIARLETNGTIDAAFNPNASSTVGDMAVQSDGKIVVEGEFTSIGGGNRSNLARLNSDGTLDTVFNPQPDFDARANIVIQPNGKILVGGRFSTISGHTTDSIARINSDGTADTTLTNPGPTGVVEAIALQSNGKIIAAGDSGIIRFNADGSVDNSFKATTNNVINALAVQSNDKVVVGGSFTLLGGQTRNNIARLNSMTSATGNVISFDTSVFNTPQTITLSLGQLLISGSDGLTINGPGVNLLTIDANSSSRIFYINPGVTATINDLTIRNGVGTGTDNGFGGGIVNRGNLTLNTLTVTSNSSSNGGGGILNENGTLTINNSIINNNMTVSNGGGIRNNNGSLTINGSTLDTNSTTGGSGNGGGIQSFSGSITITNSSILNSTSFAGGGIQFQGTPGTNILSVSNSIINTNTATSSGGGIYIISGTMMLNDSTVNGNNSFNGGGVRSQSENAFISRSTISNNTITGSGAGIFNEGTGLTVTNSTITGNTTNNGGAGIFNTGTLNLTNTTIAKNIADSDNNASGTGGGLSTSGIGVTNSRNSIFADNAAAAAPDLSGNLTSQGYNLIENITGSNITGITTGNVTGIDPQLDQAGLQNNGGATKTIAIFGTGPAIDKADPNNVLPTDQRGVARPFDGDQNAIPIADIGAFEQNCIYTLSANSAASVQ